MNQAKFLRHSMVIALSLFVLISTTSCFAGDEPVPRIRVTGEGSVELAPDMAVLNLTVTREAESATAALDANSSAMGKVLDAMKAEGIDASDLQTSGFAIQPKYVYPQPRSRDEPKTPQIVGYTVRNSLTVRVRDITRVGVILDKSIALGVNEGGNITFGNDDPSTAIRQARTMAMKQAMDKAGTLADAAEVRVGRILEISEQSFNPRPQAMFGADRMMARSAEAVPVAAGQNTYRVTVSVTFAIEQ